MNIFLIANNTETYSGMRLAGVDGVIVHSDEEFYDAFKKAFADSSVGIILIMDELYDRYSDFVVSRKLECAMPLIVSVPARGGKSEITKAVSSYIEKAIGMKI